MRPGRIVVAAVGVVVAALVVVFALVRRDDSAVISDMEALAAQASPPTAPALQTTDDDFPAIVDSAVRDPDDRVAPAAATLRVIESIDHDTGAFTQGFEFAADGRLFESTGLVGSSTLREVDPTDGTVVRSIPVPDVFAEGLTVVGDEIVQLTWTEGIAYRWTLDEFDLVRTHEYEGEGWGLCDDGARFVMSDGSPTLTFRDLDSFASIGTVEVTFNGAPVERLNELECVGDVVWANIWRTPLVIEIDPATGRVLTVVNADFLRPESTRGDGGAVLNGIAHDQTDGTLLLTGKRWPTAYRVEVLR